MNSSIHRGRYVQRGRGRGFGAIVPPQRGNGFGSIISSLFRALKPLLFKGAKAAVKVGKNVLKDSSVKTALHDIKDSALKKGAKTITDKINKLQTKNDKKQTEAVKVAKKRISKTLNTSFRNKKKKHTKKDIFS